MEKLISRTRILLKEYLSVIVGASIALAVGLASYWMFCGILNVCPV